MNVEKKITITLSPKLAKYLERAMEEGGHGKALYECAETLLWRAVQELVRTGWINKISEESDG